MNTKTFKQMKKEEATNNVVNTILGKEKESKKKKYAVNVIFDGKYEKEIKRLASDRGIGVATLIKMLVMQEINKQ